MKSSQLPGNHPRQTAHEAAIEDWLTYFKWSKPTGGRGAAIPPQPAVSLLYRTGEICTANEQPCAGGIASLWVWLGAARWASYAAAALTHADRQTLGADVATLPHEAKSLLVLTGTMTCLYPAGTDEAKADALNTLCAWFPKCHHFVKHVWDGYFVLARQARAALVPPQDDEPAPVDIPAVLQWENRRVTQCHEVPPQALTDSAHAIWTTLKQASGLKLQTRFAWHEFQMPALWRSGDHDDAHSRFTATRRNTDPALRGQGLGWANVLRGLNLTPGLAQGAAGAQTTLNARFYGLPGLLWAMAADAQLQRLKRINGIQPPALAPDWNLMQPYAPISNQDYIDAVRLTAAPKPAASSRFAAGDAPDGTQLLRLPALPLDTTHAFGAFDEEAQRHGWQLSDASWLRLSQWQGGAFASEFAGRGLAAVFCVSPAAAGEEAWCAGVCEGWYTRDDGSSWFQALPLVDDDHPLAAREALFAVDEAQLVDLTGAQLPGRYALFIRLSAVQ